VLILGKKNVLTTIESISIFLTTGNELRICSAVALKMKKTGKSESLGSAKVCMPELEMQFEQNAAVSTVHVLSFTQYHRSEFS